MSQVQSEQRTMWFADPHWVPEPLPGIVWGAICPQKWRPGISAIGHYWDVTIPSSPSKINIWASWPLTGKILKASLSARILLRKPWSRGRCHPPAPWGCWAASPSCQTRPWAPEPWSALGTRQQYCLQCVKIERTHLTSPNTIPGLWIFPPSSLYSVLFSQLSSFERSSAMICEYWCLWTLGSHLSYWRLSPALERAEVREWKLLSGQEYLYQEQDRDHWSGGIFADTTLTPGSREESDKSGLHRYSVREAGSRSQTNMSVCQSGKNKLYSFIRLVRRILVTFYFLSSLKLAFTLL